MLAAMTKTEELALDREEAKELAKAIADVNAYYGKAIDPKIFAWIGLATVAGKVYAPRVVAIKLRWMMESDKRKRPHVVQQMQAPAPQQSTFDPRMVPPPVM